MVDQAQLTKDVLLNAAVEEHGLDDFGQWDHVDEGLAQDGVSEEEVDGEPVVDA